MMHETVADDVYEFESFDIYSGLGGNQTLYNGADDGDYSVADPYPNDTYGDSNA